MLEEKVNQEFLKKYRENKTIYEQLTSEYINILKLARVYDYVTEFKKVKVVENKNFDIILEAQLKNVIEAFKEKEKKLCNNVM